MNAHELRGRADSFGRRVVGGFLCAEGDLRDRTWMFSRRQQKKVILEVRIGESTHEIEIFSAKSGASVRHGFGADGRREGNRSRSCRG